MRAKGTGTTQIGSSGGIALNVSDSSVGISTAPQTNAKLCIDVADEGTMLCSNDISQFLWRINSSSIWGMYWSTNGSGNDYYINSDSNPNQIVFVGGGVSKAAIGLGNGAFWSTDWYRVKGNGGIKWEDHGGGWTMDESTTIKVSGTKHVQCTNNLYVDERIGIGTTNPQRTLDLSTTGQITFGNNVTTSATNSGIYWHDNTEYGIYRTSEAWSGNYAQLMLKFATGIILDPGSGTHGKSHVGVVGGMSIGDTYYNTKYDNGLIVQGNVGIGTTNPQADLHITGYSLTDGILGVSGGNLYSKNNNKLQPGSLNIGSITKNYGGGTNWNSNTACLMLECADNTEIAVNNSDNRIASLMYYEGANASNTIHIGRDMAWGVTNTRCWGNLSVNGYTNGIKLGQSFEVWIGPGAANTWHFTPSVHNQSSVIINFMFDNKIYQLASVSPTPASGPVTLEWKGPAISTLYLPYPYTNQGPGQGPKFWFMRMNRLSSKTLMRIVVLYSETNFDYGKHGLPRLY